MTITPAKSAPARIVLDGRYVRLEPIAPHHAPDLYAVATLPGGPERFRWLLSNAPESVEALAEKLATSWGETDRYVAVIDKASGKAVGQQAWMRIRPEHGSIEIGGIHWGLPMARSRLSTEAFFLFARHAFDDLGYRRFEWKCNTRNEPSKAAATRFGFTFEGIFRQDQIIKGENRDTAWYSILDSEWPALRAEYDRWLSPDNFDEAGVQKTRLAVR